MSKITIEQYQDALKSAVERIDELHEVNKEAKKINKGLLEICNRQQSRFDEYEKSFKSLKETSEKLIQETIKLSNPESIIFEVTKRIHNDLIDLIKNVPSSYDRENNHSALG